MSIDPSSNNSVTQSRNSAFRWLSGHKVVAGGALLCGAALTLSGVAVVSAQENSGPEATQELTTGKQVEIQDEKTAKKAKSKKSATSNQSSDSYAPSSASTWTTVPNKSSSVRPVAPSRTSSDKNKEKKPAKSQPSNMTEGEVPSGAWVSDPIEVTQP